MEKVFDSSVINMIPLPKGIAVSYCLDKNSDYTAAGYKTVSFADGRVSSVAADIYMTEKFGDGYKLLPKSINDCVNCFAAHLSNGDLAVVQKNGDAMLLNTKMEIKWQGSLNYMGATPTGLTVVGRKIWVSYKDANAIVRYNSVTMKSELRIGGGENPAFLSPMGMWLANNKMIICCAKEKKLCRVDLDTFQIEDMDIFTEPVYQYFSISGYELVRVDSGVYLL